MYYHINYKRCKRINSPIGHAIPTIFAEVFGIRHIGCITNPTAFMTMSHFLFLFFLPLFVSRQKKEGAILSRVSGEAVGCPVRNHGRKSAHRAHSPLRKGSYWSKLLHFTRAKTMRRTQSLELSAAYYSTSPAVFGRQFARIARGRIQAFAPSSVERVSLSSTQYCRLAQKCHAGNWRILNLVEHTGRIEDF